jgi:acyl carrier protein
MQEHITSPNRAEILRIMEENFGAKPGSLTGEEDFRHDLDIDSLDEVECLMALEEGFEVDIPDELALECTTINDLIAVVEGVIRGG